MASIGKQALAYLSTHQRSALTLKELARKIDVASANEYQALRKAMDDMERRGLIDVDESGRMKYLRQKAAKVKEQAPPKKLTGRLSMSRRGFGFVTPDGTDDEYFIAPRFMKTALHGDLVAIHPFAKRGNRRGGDKEKRSLEGEISEIIERSTTTITGRLEKNGRVAFVVPDDARFSRDVYLSSGEAERANHGDKVVVRMMPWTDEHLNPEGEIVEVLGVAGDARVEVLSVARTFNLPPAFPPAVERDADALPAAISAEDLRGRVDLRKTLCITIDPDDAKDFDDAVSYEALPAGGARIGVHIADVSHYVREGSLLDAEAFARGTSVYLVNEVVPMLPERISNDLCSLRPHVDRLTYSVFMDVNAAGTVTAYSIAKSVIHSARRFAYEEVQKIIEAGKGECAEIILPLHGVARTLSALRKKNGSIDFDTSEAKFRFDKTGLPTAIMKKERLDAHRLIEECMLLANRTVAEHIGKVRKDAEVRPFLYRVHDAPDPSRLTDLANFVKQFGFALDAKGPITSRALQKLLDKVKGSEVENLINEVALRSMAKAVYAEKNIGHYGLGFVHYTHFTSPIRRYPDLVVHRLLLAYEEGMSVRQQNAVAKSLPEIARKTSERERVATEAERASVKVMQVEYMKRHIGDEFEGVIGGVTNFGMFVEINDLLVEGFISIRDLSDDYYVFDDKRYALKGRSRGKTYRLGDVIRVRVANVKPEERQIEFAPV